MEHERNNDLPEWLRWSLVLFDRAGFPALAFVLITYICFVTMKEQTKAIMEFRASMVSMATAIDHNSVSMEHMAEAIYRGKRQ